MNEKITTSDNDCMVKTNIDAKARHPPILLNIHINTQIEIRRLQFSLGVGSNPIL